MAHRRIDQSAMIDADAQFACQPQRNSKNRLLSNVTSSFEIVGREVTDSAGDDELVTRV